MKPHILFLAALLLGHGCAGQQETPASFDGPSLSYPDLSPVDLGGGDVGAPSAGDAAPGPTRHLPATNALSAIVATIHSKSLPDGTAQCMTASNPTAAAAGYWDLGGYAACDADGTPRCEKGSHRITLAMTTLPDGSVKRHTVCVLDGQSSGTAIVATIHGKSLPGGTNQCLTASDPAAAAAGYWDLGGYSSCDADGTPRCNKGSRKVITAMTMLADKSVKYHTACVLTGQTAASAVVATILSRQLPGGTNSCMTALNPTAASAGYWDLGGYSACDAAGIPRCVGGSRKVLMSAALLADGSVKYHTACVVRQAAPSTPFVAAISDETSAQGVGSCKTASDPAAAAAGHWDLGGWGACDASGNARCARGSRKVLTAATRLPDGTVEHHTACVFPTLLRDGTASTKGFSDGRTIIVFAHQDDDLLWMLPFWFYSKKLLLTAYPAAPQHKQVVSQHPEEYRKGWANPFGDVDEATFVGTYLDPCKRKSLINVKTIKAKLAPHVADPAVARVVTHNNWGEYGHVQHRYVNQAVRELAVAHGKDVWALSVRAEPARSKGYLDTGDMGLPSIHATFDRGAFLALRAVYQKIFITYKGAPLDLWTWHDGDDEYPTGERLFVKIVDKGNDLSKSNTAVQQLVSSVPPYGDCKP
jgi:hypothetical protein